MHFRLLQIKLIALVISAASFNYLQAQDDQVNSTYIPFDSLAVKLEKKFSIHLYYKPEWVNTQKFNSGIENLSLDEALAKIKVLTKLNYINPDAFSYVFVPVEISYTSGQGSSDNLSVQEIGNPAELGRYSKATIDGKILDGKTGEPLPGASLYIDKLKLGTTSDKNGHFNITIPVGEYDLKYSFIGFEDNFKKIKLISNGTLSLELFEKSVKLQEVVISADRAEYNVSRTQMSMVKLDARAIKELPSSLGETDILKSISLLPGVQSVGEFGTGFNVRGGSADQNLILLEDVPLFNSSHVFGLTSVINPDAVANVTLLKAGIPAKYGERASSVMDIRMGNNNPDKIRVRGGIGLINSRLNVDLPLIDKKANLQIGGRSSYSDWLLQKVPDVDLMNSSAHFYDINALLALNVNPSNKISIFGYQSSDGFGFSKNTNYFYGNRLSSVRWNHIFGKKFSTNLVVGMSQYNYQVNDLDTAKRWEAYKISSKLNYNNVKWNLSWLPTDKHSVDFGINGIVYRINPGDLTPYKSESTVVTESVQQEKAYEAGIYVGDNYTITDHLGIEAGLRYSFYAYLGPSRVLNYDANQPVTVENITDTSFYGNNSIIQSYSGLEPRLSLRYTLSESSSLKLSYNRINQYINLISNTAIMTPSDVWKLSDSHLKPLTCDQYAIGYFRNFKNNTIEASAELYYKTLRNSIDYKNGAKILMNDHIETDLVNTDGYNYGVELYAKKNSGRLTGWASYTYSVTERKTNSIFSSDQINKNNYFLSNYDRPHDLVMVGNYHISRRWRFSGSFNYSTGRPVTLPEFKYNFGGNQLIYYSDRNKYRLPDYHRLDVSITLDESLRIKKKWKGSWTFSIINLYGRKNAYSVFYQKVKPMESNNYQQYALYKLYIIGRPLPTFTYNFTF